MPDHYAKQDMTEKPKAASQIKGGSIFDRLTDPSTYQASHRARFNDRPDVKHDHIKLQEASNINKSTIPLHRLSTVSLQVPRQHTRNTRPPVETSQRLRPRSRAGLYLIG